MRKAIYGLLVGMLLFCALVSAAQGTLNPAGALRYGSQTLAPGFTPPPFSIDVNSGGAMISNR